MEMDIGRQWQKNMKLIMRRFSGAGFYCVLKFPAIAVLIMLLACPIQIWAAGTSYDIGGGRNDYPAITALLENIELRAGDVVNIYPGIYFDLFSVGADNYGDQLNHVLIRGVDQNGDPIDSPQETVVFDRTGKNVGEELDIFGDNITLQGLCVRNSSEVAVQTNSANTVLRHILFKNNSCSLQTKINSENITVEYCEFSSSGKLVQSHDIYGLHADKLTIQFCYFHDAPSPVYNIIKSRDYQAHILYNYIEMGVAPYAIDLPHNEISSLNQNAYVVGNIIKRTQISSDGGFSYIKFNQETGARNGNIFIINNTFVDEAGVVGAAFSMKLEAGYSWEIDNNIFCGIHDLTRDATHIGSLAGRNNLLMLNVPPDGLTGSIFSDDPRFDASYKLLSNSPAINAGYGPTSIVPVFQYSNSEAGISRPSAGAIDIGAFEYTEADLTPPAEPGGLGVK